ncbi:uncharacterized protein CTRU02_214310 [Colletotrichum truncatum]|uniref:Uncharacterized protein n=1 Tax=Colletotrichum truncatum TaxID=5467 RepID=A0ACC3YI75_COLTU|nr:uncharacterized protein CTRU02_11385 [Colletotrichum truncatum]KAF6786127.1 hypothetical protein CTRU02_11385 [Colletotrichum truncatum]
MSFQRRIRGSGSLPIALTVGAIITVALYFYSPLQLPTMAEPSLFLANLQLSLSQSASRSPSITVSVKNTHSDTPVTILKWNSPLDPAALGLGQVSILPAGSSEPIHNDAIKISRIMPPGAESLITLRPGESAENTVELREPRVPDGIWKQGKAKVTMRGRWMAVWPGLTTEDLLQHPEKLQGVGAGEGSLIGNWETETIEVGKQGDGDL